MKVYKRINNSGITEYWVTAPGRPAVMVSNFEMPIGEFQRIIHNYWQRVNAEDALISAWLTKYPGCGISKEYDGSLIAYDTQKRQRISRQAQENRDFITFRNCSGKLQKGRILERREDKCQY